MALLLTACTQCSRPALLDERELTPKASCPTCGADARVVPGCSFGTADVALFDELKQALAEARLAPKEAQKLAFGLAAALQSGALGAAFQHLSDRLPSLLLLQAAAGSNPAAQRRVMMALRVLLEAGSPRDGNAGDDAGVSEKGSSRRWS